MTLNIADAEAILTSQLGESGPIVGYPANEFWHSTRQASTGRRSLRQVELLLPQPSIDSAPI